MLLGEAPGREEDEFGQPFVGQAGTILTGCCTEAGLPRERCRIGNVVPRRPPGNRKPTAKEIVFYREGLISEIEATHPRVIVALGDIPLKALTGLTWITKRRGMEITTAEGWIVVPTFHPAYALPNRNPQARKWIVADLRKARQLAGEGPRGSEPVVHIVNAPEQLPAISADAVIAYDVETTGLDSLDPEKRMVGVGISWSEDEGYYVLPPAWPMLVPILGDAKRLVAHNGMFDNRWLRRYDFDPSQTFDTLLAAYLLDDTRPTYKLERLAVEMLDIPPYHAATESALEAGKADEIAPDILGGRCGRDACYTLRLYWKLRAQIVGDPRLVRAFKYLMMPSARLAEHMMDAGLPLDMPLIEQRIEACRTQGDIQLAMMRQIAQNEKFNPLSPLQVGKVLTDILHLPMLQRTPTGRVATGEEVLAHFTDQPFIVSLQTYRKTFKYLMSYYQRWKARSREGRVYGHIWIAKSDVGSDRMHGTSTGRFSGDLQQTPKQFENTPEVYRVKDVVLAKPGRTLVEVDLSQIELRVMAWLGPERAMLKAYQEGKDLHIETARDVLGIPAPTKADRSKAKPVNFGRLYGMGDEHFQEYALTEYGIHFTLEQCAEIGRRFFTKYPDLPKYYRRCEREARQTKAIRTPFGRTRRLPDVDSPLPERRSHAMRQAINTPVQGTASDLNLLVAIEAQKFSPPHTQLLMLFHDASFWEIDEAEAETFALAVVYFVRHRLTPVVRDRFGVTVTVPLDADAKIGRRWGMMNDLTINPG